MRNNDSNQIKLNDIIKFDQYETYKYNEIKKILIDNGCSQMMDNERKFLNGIIRFSKPKKILEVGVRSGGSSSIILNAIEDFKDSKLYSIDLDSDKSVGECVYKYFPNLTKQWTLYKGNIATEYMEKIGNNIDMVFIDTAHFEPGEILDSLIVLPFLKTNAIMIFHDISQQINHYKRYEWAPYIIFNGLRGKKYLPSGKNILNKNIGAIQLEKNQKKYYHDYFRLLGGQWQYYPKEIHINQIYKYFQKHYDKECLIMFIETITFNKVFVKLNPEYVIYNYTKD